MSTRMVGEQCVRPYNQLLCDLSFSSLGRKRQKRDLKETFRMATDLSRPITSGYFQSDVDFHTRDHEKLVKLRST